MFTEGNGEKKNATCSIKGGTTFPGEIPSGDDCNVPD